MKPKDGSTKSDDASDTGVEAAAWEKLPSESAKWFARFNLFRAFGSARSIDMAWRHENRTKTNKNGRAPDSWHDAAKRHDWCERALAWDLDEAERYRQQIIAERDRRLKLALRNRQRREGYLVGLDLTLRSHAEKLRNGNKLDAEQYVRSIEWSEARLQTHFNLVERMIRLSQAEFNGEERFLAEIAVHQQQRAEVVEVPLQEEHNLRTGKCKHVISGRADAYALLAKEQPARPQPTEQSAVHAVHLPDH